MPNTEVKLTNAESTWPEAAREDRKLLIDIKKDTQKSVFFYVYRERTQSSRDRDSGRTDLQERKRRTKRVSRMQSRIANIF